MTKRDFIRRVITKSEYYEAFKGDDMKVWKEKAKIPGFGICEVREFSDKDCTKLDIWCPISSGFVNLYKDNERVGWCGSNYADKRRITHASI